MEHCVISCDACDLILTCDGDEEGFNAFFDPARFRLERGFNPFRCHLCETCFARINAAIEGVLDEIAKEEGEE